MNAARRVAPLLSKFLGPAAPVHVEFWDGSSFGRDDAPARIVVRSPTALQRIIRSPGELGFGRAYVAGELDVLEASRDEAVRLAGEGRYRVWRIYMAASALNFEAGRTQVHQILGSRSDDGASGVPLRRGDTVL